ncbi:MAG: hypothetical protein AAFU70_14565, partial [Planctomycetota bacterium]
AIAVIWVFLGTMGWHHGEDSTTRYVGMAFAIGALPIAALGLIVARSYRLVFDRRRGALTLTVHGLATVTERATIPLDRVRHAEIEVTRETADPDTYRLVLAIEPGPGWPDPVLPFRDYSASGTPPRKLCAIVNRWLGVA